MLEDVLDATLLLPGWETWVVSPDESVLEVAAGRGATPMPEEQPPLAQAIRQAEEEALSRGMDTRAVHTLGPVVLAPAADETGTNLLLRRPPLAISSSFGRDSYRRHLEEAAQRDVPVAVIEHAELAFDVDLPDDILTVVNDRRAGRTREVLRAIDVSTRVHPATWAR